MLGDGGGGVLTAVPVGGFAIGTAWMVAAFFSLTPVSGIVKFAAFGSLDGGGGVWQVK